MIGLSISESTRAAALDGSLSFSILLQNQRELTVGTAQSSVNGLLTAILSAPTDYAKLLDVNDSAVTAQATSATKLSKPAWTAAPDATQTAISNYLEQQLEAEITAARSQVNPAVAQATSAKNGATQPSTEYDLAASLETSGNQLLSGLSQLEGNQDAQAAQTIATAKSDIQSTLQSAQVHLATLLAANPSSPQDIATTQATIAAAQALLAAANTAESVVSSTLAGPAGQPATSYQLTTDTPPTTYLTSWGDSGAITLTDDTGKGIVITSDGKVDTIPPSGDGWQFKNDATFLLPDGTKVTVSPGNPASVLATRGQQQIAITNLRPGQSPTVTLSKTGGLAADAARNDGYIFAMGTDQQSWTLSGATLGGANGSREVVATTPLDNEYAVDVTNIPIDPALVAQLQSLGIDANAFDVNHDGKFSNAELQTLVAAVDALVVGAQHKFDAAIANGTTASASLLKLNQFLEKVLADTDRRQADQQKVSAEERDQLLQIQQDLDTARDALRRTQSQTPTQGGNAPGTAPRPTIPNNTDLLSIARVVLNQIGNFGGKETPTLSKLSNQDQTLPPATGTPSGTLPLVTGPSGNTVSQALRRAERLLSGLSGGASGRRTQDAVNTSGEKGTTPGAQPSSTPAFPLGSTPQLPPAPPDNLLPNPTVTPPTNASVLGRDIPPLSDATILAATPGSAAALGGLETKTDESVRAPNQSQNQIAQTLPVISRSPASALPPSEPPVPASRQQQGDQVGLADPRPSTLSGLIAPAKDALVGGPLQPPVPPVQPPTLPTADNASLTPPAPASGLKPLEGTRFPATGPDTNVAPDPTFGAPDGFAREFRRRIDQHLGTYREQTSRAQQLQTNVRDVVERFVTLVSQDEQLRQVFNAADLSDAQKADLKSKVQNLERDLGLTWGDDAAKTPQAEANLNARVFTSGMMI